MSLIVLMIWINDDPIQGNVMKIGNIVEPRIGFNDYYVGQSVKARCAGFGNQRGVIGKIGDESKRKEFDQLLNGPGFQELVKKFSTDTHPIMEEECSTHPITEGECSRMKATPKRPRVIDAYKLIHSAKPIDLLSSNDQDEVQEVAKTKKMKRDVTKERQKQSDKSSESLLLSTHAVQPKTQSGGVNMEERFTQLEHKVDNLKEFLSSFLSCRQCLRKAYKGTNPCTSPVSSFNSPSSRTPAGPKSMTEAGPSKETPAGPKSMTEAGPSKETPAGPKSMTEAGPSKETPACSSSVKPGSSTVVLGDDSETQRIDWGGIDVPEQAAMEYLGDPRFGVKLCATDINRCVATAKTVEKLGLNLIEFLVAPEEMACTTVYGNHQYKKHWKKIKERH